jgi:N-acetylglucosaminyldiphosphoundecaprenol N-acetyl-beta-D-mannosaminyltransferase
MNSQVRILGANIDQVRMDEAMKTIHGFVVSQQPHQVVTVNLDFLRIAQENPEFQGVINRSDLAVADGMPLVWASQWLGTPLPERVTGVELVDECCALAAREGYSIFLLGGAEGVPEAAAAKMVERHPGLQIAGTYSPPMGPFSPEEDAKIVDMIRAAKPQMLFVAFGAPKQDIWIAQHRNTLGVPVAVGVGGVFNFLTGRVRRAPEWMQRSGLEWLYRVSQEPRRLWRRYFVQDMPVMMQMAAEAMQLRTLGPAQQAPHGLNVPVAAEIAPSHLMSRNLPN